MGEESIGRRIERSKEGEEEKQEDNNESAAAEVSLLLNQMCSIELIMECRK